MIERDRDRERERECVFVYMGGFLLFFFRVCVFVLLLLVI